jgi:hypothetical protein
VSSTMKSRTSVAGVFASALVFLFLCGSPTQATTLGPEFDLFGGTFTGFSPYDETQPISVSATFTVEINVAGGLGGGGCNGSCIGIVTAMSGTWDLIPNAISLLPDGMYGSDDYVEVTPSGPGGMFQITFSGNGTAFTALGMDYGLIDPEICSTSGNCIPLTTFSVTDNLAATPLPAALPLFAGGLGALGLLGWCRKRKNAAAISAA